MNLVCFEEDHAVLEILGAEQYHPAMRIHRKWVKNCNELNDSENHIACLSFIKNKTLGFC